jgi:glycosyltransferase involved in cell wall biosynthesis
VYCVNGVRIKMTVLALFTLWERVDELALGGIKYGAEVIKRFKKLRCICLTTQRIGFNHERSIGEKFTLYSKRASRRIMYYILCIVLIIKGMHYLKKERIKVVFSPGVGWINDIAAFFISLLSRKRLVMTFYHWPYQGWDRRSVYSSLRREGRGILGSIIKMIDVEIAKRCSLHADLIVTLSQSSKVELMSIGVPEEKILLAYPGIDDEFFEEEGGSPPKVFDAISVCRIAPEKGIYDLIEIWRRIVANKKLMLGVIGTPTKILDKWLLKVKENNLAEFIEYLGVMERKSMIRILKNAKVFAFASRKEGFGIAVAEAMACGLPVVCYDIPPLNEIFTSEGVFFVKPFDYDDFAKKVIMLVEDEELRRKAGECNKRFALKFKWDETAKIIEESLLALMRGKS